MTHQRPADLVELLSGVVRASDRTPFYSGILKGRTGISDLEDFDRIPVTPLAVYRRQSLADVLADPAGIDWIVGPYRGRADVSVAVTEGTDEGAVRYQVFTDAVKPRVSFQEQSVCAVVTSADKRYFAAEIATILIRSGVPSHVFTDSPTGRAYQLLRETGASLLVILSGHLAEEELPESIRHCITFRRSQRMRHLPQLDFYIIDELGFLGHSTDCETYTLHENAYYFQWSDSGNLIVTALYNRIQPMIRIETMDRVEPLGSNTVRFTKLSAG